MEDKNINIELDTTNYLEDIPTTKQDITSSKDSKDTKIKSSYENPHIKRIYKEFIGKPSNEKAQELLHIEYKDESDLLKFDNKTIEDERLRNFVLAKKIGRH